MVNIFGNNIVGAFTNGNVVKAIYNGNVKVWPSTPAPQGDFYFWFWNDTDNAGSFKDWNGTIFDLNNTAPSYVFTSTIGSFKSGAFTFSSDQWIHRMSTNYTYFGSNALEGLRGLNYLSAYSCSYIGKSCFYNNTNLYTVYAPRCQYIETSAFYGCTHLYNININECQHIGSQTFYGCTDLKSMNLPKCSYIGSSAFKGCTLLSTITTGGGYIGDNAFYGCTSLTSVNLGSCSYIGNNAFNMCSNLTNVIADCEYIGYGAFYDCSKLTTLSFPNCKTIEGPLFNVSTFKKLTLGGSEVCQLTADLYGYYWLTPKTLSVMVPASLVTTYKTSPYWSNISSRIFPIS